MLPETIVALTAAAAVYHHILYPPLLATLAARKSAKLDAGPAGSAPRPSVTLIVPAHDEAAVIRQKVANLAALQYPRERLSIVIACDGCTDDTAQIARDAAAAVPDTDIDIIVYGKNRGKVAVINELIEGAETEIVALSDASAMLERDALERSVAYFADTTVGVVCPTYQLMQPGSEGEAAYWRYQAKVKANEAIVAGGPLGAHGAFYLFRRSAWRPLPADTINDDFILPSRILEAGLCGIYDPTIVTRELERTDRRQEFRRRIRIGAGNMQQAVRLASWAWYSHPGRAFAFLSGKGLRVAIPFLALVALPALTALSFEGNIMATMLLVAGIVLASTSVFAINRWQVATPKPLAWLGYLVQGHAASFLGAVRYLAGLEGRPWARANTSAVMPAPTRTDDTEMFVPPAVHFSKRLVDIVCALGALAVLTVLFVPLALAIKLTSRGPIFYRQLRVGYTTPNTTHLFHLIKFRTMRVDAEAATGAVWATKDDPRITPVGRFMRKTRLDELPQCINVLRGEMAVVGPRPERPSFFSRLEDAIPYYSERTYGVRPGITGLAQINQAYDASIEDVRNKVLYDHAYAAQLMRWRDWLRADLSIMFHTITVMALGKGQ